MHLEYVGIGWPFQAFPCATNPGRTLRRFQRGFGSPFWDLEDFSNGFQSQMQTYQTYQASKSRLQILSQQNVKNVSTKVTDVIGRSWQLQPQPWTVTV